MVLLFQFVSSDGTMNALENVALPLTFRGEPRKERIKKADRMLDLVSWKNIKNICRTSYQEDSSKE